MSDERALGGLRVIDVTHVMAGSYCSMLLADLGADVIKVERPLIGDLTRWAGDGVDAFGPLNRNKRSVCLDLGAPVGREALLELVRGADVLVENQRPGQMQRWNLGYEDCAAVNPALVYCSISGFGTTGPLAEDGGFDLMAQGMSGVMSLTGEAGGEPCKVGVPISDLNAATFGALGVLAALNHRERSGVGQHVTTSLLESTVAYLVWEATMLFQQGVVGEPGGSAHRLSAPYEAFPTADGAVTVAAPQPDVFAALCRVVEREDLLEDERFTSPPRRLRNRDALAEQLGAAFTRRRTEEWLAELRAAGVPCGPVLDVGGVFEHPQVLATGMVEGSGTQRRIGPPVKLSATPMAVERDAPELGEHTREVLAEAGWDDERIEAAVAETRREDR